MLPVQSISSTFPCTNKQVFDPTAPQFLSFFADLNDESFQVELNKQVCVFDSDNFIKIKHNEAKNPFSVVKDRQGNVYALSRKVLGAGTAAKVKLAQNLKTNEVVAVKISHGGHLREDIRGLESLHRFHGEQIRYSKDGLKHYVFMNYFQGVTVSRFKNHIRAHDLTLPLEQLILFRDSLLKAVDVLIEKNISHDDFHPGNVLIDPRTWKAEIIDLGLCTDVRSSGECMKSQVQLMLDAFVPNFDFNQDSPLYPMVRELFVVARSYMKYEFLIKLATCARENHTTEHFLSELISAIFERETFSSKSMLIELLTIVKKYQDLQVQESKITCFP